MNTQMTAPCPTAWAAIKAKMQINTISPPAPAAFDACESAVFAAVFADSRVAPSENSTGCAPEAATAVASTSFFFFVSSSCVRTATRAGLALLRLSTADLRSTAADAALNCGAQVKNASAHSPSERI